MSRIAKTWIDLGRALRRRRRKRGKGQERWSYRYPWIAEHAPGNSFADIGGLYGAAGDVAFAAEAAGASPVTMFDGGDVNLTEFPAKAEARGSKVRNVQGDLEDPETVRQIGIHDIVWCTGVLYHTPNPLLQLMHLREITGKLLYLGTYTVPEVPGIPQACIFYPFLDEGTRIAILRGHGMRKAGLGLGLPFDEEPMRGHGNFWWGISPSALRAFLRAARFEIVAEAPLEERPFMVDVIARPVDKAPMLPPVTYYRERFETRERGEPTLPFETFYEDTGRGYV